MRVWGFISVILLTGMNALAAQGEDSYQSRCTLCHGADAAGTDRAQSILLTLYRGSRDRLLTIITEGVPSKGMPAFNIPDEELNALITHLKDMAESAAHRTNWLS